MPPPRRLTAVPDRAGRAVLYIRVSATMGRGGDDFHSPDLQLDAMRRHIAPVGLREVAVVSDIDISGRSFSREGLDKVRAMVEAKQVDVLAVYNLSRLGRNTAEALTFIRWLRERNVTIVSTVEKFDDTPEGQLMLTQWLGWAQFHSDTIGRNWGEVLARRARDQGLGHGKAPIGYIKKGRELVKDPAAGPAIADIIRAYADGESTISLARKIGVLRGHPVESGTVRILCTSRVYLGEVRSHQDWYPGAHEPLVSDEVHAAAVARAARDADMPARSRTPAHSLSGLIWCDICKRRGRVHTATYSSGRPPQITLMCANQTARYPKGCAGFGTPRLAKIEAEVLAQLRHKVSQLRDDPEARTARRDEHQRLQRRRGQIQRELDAETAALGRLAGEWARRKTPAKVYEAAVAEFNAKEAQLRAELAGIDVPPAAIDDERFAMLADRLIEAWPRLDGVRRGEGLRLVVRRVTVRRGEEPRSYLVDVDFF